VPYARKSFAKIKWFAIMEARGGNFGILAVVNRYSGNADNSGYGGAGKTFKIIQ
jgi:hypothetical protein